MYCPKCGQEQPAESVRFCSRCGFELSTIEGALSTRLLSIAMYLVLTVFAIFGWGSFTSGPQYAQIRVVVTVIAAIAFYLIFQNDLKHIFHKLFSGSAEPTERVISATQQSSLPPVRSVPAPSPARRANTAEIVQPPSITEHTTRLLDESKG